MCSASRLLQQQRQPLICCGQAGKLLLAGSWLLLLLV
jgi:hypothetical protein